MAENREAHALYLRELEQTKAAVKEKLQGGNQLRREGSVVTPLEWVLLDWQEDGYTFYCDGEVVSKANKAVSAVPQFILLTTEIRGYRAGRPLKVGEHSIHYEAISEGTIERVRDEFIDDAFVVDFVRVFDRVNHKKD